MMASTGKTAQQLLDEVHRLVQLEQFSAELYAQRLAAELAPAPVETLDDLEARDAGLRAALVAIDRFAGRAMRVHLDHALTYDNSVAKPFRTYLANAVVSYEGALPLLRERALAAVARLDPQGAAAIADRIVEAAAAVLALRAALRAEVLGLARAQASAALPIALAGARDHRLPDPVRLRWSAARRDLTQVAEAPERVAHQAFADRLKALPPAEEPLEEAPEPTRGELIELY